MTIFLDIQDVLEIHECVIRETGGGTGIRDRGLLESALAQPQASFGGVELCQTLEAKAAAYCYSIVMNHPFVDGNKRTGFVAADTFLRINQHFIKVDQSEGEKTILKLASGQLPKEELTVWIAEHLLQLDD